MSRFICFDFYRKDKKFIEHIIYIYIHEYNLFSLDYEI